MTLIATTAGSGSTATTALARPTRPTSPGALITVAGGPNATANIPGPRNDSADFYGIFLALAIIVVAIAVTRVVFGWRGGSTRASRPTGPAPAASPPEAGSTPPAPIAPGPIPPPPPPRGEATTPGSP